MDRFQYDGNDPHWGCLGLGPRPTVCNLTVHGIHINHPPCSLFLVVTASSDAVRKEIVHSYRLCCVRLVEVGVGTGKGQGGRERGGDEGKLQLIFFVAVIILCVCVCVCVCVW